MAKVTIKGFDKIKANVQRALDTTLRDQNFLNDIGDTIVKNNKGGGRQGKDADGNKWGVGLETSTVNQRDRLSRVNPTADTYSKRRDNLTFTGQLIDSLYHKADTAKKTIALLFKDARKPYKYLNGSTSKSTINNSQLYDIHKVKRPFLGIGSRLKAQIVNKVKAQLRRTLRRF